MLELAIDEATKVNDICIISKHGRDNKVVF